MNNLNQNSIDINSVMCVKIFNAKFLANIYFIIIRFTFILHYYHINNRNIAQIATYNLIY